MDYKHNLEFKADAIYLGDELIDALYIGDDLLYQNLAEKPAYADNLFVFKTTNNDDVSVIIGFDYPNYRHTKYENFEADKIYQVPVDVEDLIKISIATGNSYFESILSFPKALNLKSLSWICFSNLSEFNAMNLNTSKVNDFSGFLWNTTVDNLIIGNLDFISADSYSLCFSGLNIKTFTGNISNLKFSLNLSRSKYLEKESALKFINATLPVEETETLTFHKDVYEQLLQEEIAVATERGWSIIRS